MDDPSAISGSFKALTKQEDVNFFGMLHKSYIHFFYSLFVGVNSFVELEVLQVKSYVHCKYL